VEDIRHRGCAAAGVRLAGEALSGICRLDLYGAWRLLTVFEAPDLGPSHLATSAHLDNTLEDYRREIQRRVFGSETAASTHPVRP
jgi:hypothetical protein